MCDFNSPGRSRSVDISEATQGEVTVARDENCIELQVISPALPKARVYAFEPSDRIGDFCDQLAADLDLEKGSVEVITPSGASMSPNMSHTFAWKPGRIVRAGELDLAVSIVTIDDGELDTFAPSKSGRRPTARVAAPVNMKYMVISGGVVSGLGKGVTASSLGVLMRSAGCGAHSHSAAWLPRRIAFARVLRAAVHTKLPSPQLRRAR